MNNTKDITIDNISKQCNTHIDMNSKSELRTPNGLEHELHTYNGLEGLEHELHTPNGLEHELDDTDYLNTTGKYIGKTISSILDTTTWGANILLHSSNKIISSCKQESEQSVHTFFALFKRN